MAKFFFYLGLGTLFTHELDAMTNSEWRVLPGLSLLADEAGRIVFVIIHVPLFAVLVWLVSHPSDKVRFRSEVAISLFLIIHLVLHLAFSGHEHYEFSSGMSRTLIYGAGAFGAMHLVLLKVFRRAGRS